MVTLLLSYLRKRAGMPDKTSVDLDILRNERAVELAFEDHSYWDLRRWGMTDVMAEPVTGVTISAVDGMPTYVVVENRNYQPYQIYGPIPYGETLKYDLIQNEGWQ